VAEKGNLDKIENCTECVCFNLRMATRAITQVYDKAMQPSGLRATQFPLLAVLAIGGPSTITGLSQFLVMDRTTLARNLKPLEKRGLISIAKGKDKRTKTLTLTELGAEAIGDALPRWERAQKMVVEKMGENRWQATLESLRALPSLFPLDSAAAPAASEVEQ
jgi:DNA-binding MarR family transcriptional regulator